MPDQTEIKVDIESLKKDIENINNIQGRLDTAIDKLTDVSTSIKSMLAVHEEKIQRQEQVDDIIFRKLKERDSEVDDIFRDLQREMEQVEKRLLNEIRSITPSINLFSFLNRNGNSEIRESDKTVSCFIKIIVLFINLIKLSALF